MNDNNIQKCLDELTMVREQLQNMNEAERSTRVIENIVRLIKCIAFLQKEHYCDDEVDAVNENISLYYLHRAKITGIVDSISALEENTD